MTENPKTPSITLIKVLLIIITLAVCLQTYWTYIAYRIEIRNFHESEPEKRDRLLKEGVERLKGY
jgi:uncharacterized membrane protein